TFSTYLVDNRDQARVTDSTTTTSLGATRRPSKMRAMCKCQHARGDDPAPHQRAVRLNEQLGDVVIEIAARSIAHRNHEPVELATRMKNQPLRYLSSCADSANDRIPNAREVAVLAPSSFLLVPHPIAIAFCSPELLPVAQRNPLLRADANSTLRDCHRLCLSVMKRAVRRQNIWHNSRRKLAECGPRPRVDIKRRSCGGESGDVRWSSVWSFRAV